MNESVKHAPVRPNSLSLRDRAFVLHPMTNLAQHLEEGPLVIERGRGVYVEDDEGKRYIEGVSGLWSISLGFGQERLAKAAYDQMTRLASYHLFRFKSTAPAIELAERLIAMAPGSDVESVFRQFRLGSERHCAQTGLVLQQCPWQAQQEEGHRTQGRLSRRHHRSRQYHRARAQPHRLRSAHSRHPSYGLPALLALWPAWRERGGFRHSPGRQSRATDSSRGAGHGRCLLRRAGDGVRRCNCAAANLLREDPGGSQEIRSSLRG